MLGYSNIPACDVQCIQTYYCGGNPTALSNEYQGGTKFYLTFHFTHGVINGTSVTQVSVDKK